MTKYLVSYTTKDGKRIENQLYTLRTLTGKLEDLENTKATDIIVKGIDTSKEEYKQYR